MVAKDDILKQIAGIEAQMALPDFWSDKDKAQVALKEYQALKASLTGTDGHDKGDALVSIISGAGGDDAGGAE